MSAEADEHGNVVVFAEMKRETEKAWLLTDNFVTEWVPKSRIKKIGDGVYCMPEWLALKKGFV